VQSIKRHRTKNGEDMAFLTLEDAAGTMDAIVFPKLYAVSAPRLQKDKLLYVTGRISRKEDEVSIICESVRVQEEFPAMLRQMQLCIKWDADTSHETLAQLTTLCRDYPGETRIVFYLTQRRAYSVPKQPLYAEVSEGFFGKLSTLFLPEQLGMIPPFPQKT
jgi:DNA polymerase-3 subunit alpha